MNTWIDHLREDCSILSLLHPSRSMFCENIDRLVVARAVTLSYALSPNEQYSYKTYCGKVVANFILNNVP